MLYSDRMPYKEDKVSILFNYVRIHGNVNPDQMHTPISVSPHLPVSKVVKYINGESRGKLQEEFQKLRKRYSRQYPGKPVFWRNVRTDK